jgi:hypothetical protein
MINAQLSKQPRVSARASRGVPPVKAKRAMSAVSRTSLAAAQGPGAAAGRATLPATQRGSKPPQLMFLTENEIQQLAQRLIEIVREKGAKHLNELQGDTLVREIGRV